MCTFCKIFVSYNCTGGCGLSLFVFVLCVIIISQLNSDCIVNVLVKMSLSYHF